MVAARRPRSQTQLGRLLRPKLQAQLPSQLLWLHRQLNANPDGMQTNARITPIWHVSFPSSSESEGEATLHCRPNTPKRAGTPPRGFTIPDPYITEREPLTSDEEEDCGSLRSGFKKVVLSALSSQPRKTLEERFENLSLLECRRLSAGEQLQENLKRMNLRGCPRTEHRRKYTGSQLHATRRQKEDHDASAPTAVHPYSTQPNAAEGLICPGCGHCFSMRKSLNMHRKVCVALKNNAASVKLSGK